MTLIETRELKAFYGDFQALFGVDIVLSKPVQAALVIGMIDHVRARRKKA